MILSYHPFFHGHRFRLCAAREPNEKDRELMSRASAVILPLGRLPALYEQAVHFCGLVFPNYNSRYAYPGKIGDIHLFQKNRLSHPRSDCFFSLAQCPSDYWASMKYPVIIKHSTGGEGRLVYGVHNPQEAGEVLSVFQGMERSGLYGFLVQELVPADQRTLRVVVMHNRMYSYWRVQPEAGKVVHNLAQGGEIDHFSDPELQDQGKKIVERLCQRTGINLAGIDVLFDCGKNPPKPLLLEINYFFAVNGLGGLDAYHWKLKQAVKEWLLDHDLPLPTKDFG
jgi:ribosomal protein S6--L-glutamate ligase